MADQGFEGGTRSMQILFHSVCILFAAVSLDKVSDMAIPRGSMGGTYKGEGYRETSEPLRLAGLRGRPFGG